MNKYQLLLEYVPNVNKFLQIVEIFEPKDEMFEIWKNTCLYYFAKQSITGMNSHILYKYRNDKVRKDKLTQMLICSAKGRDVGEV